MRLEFLLPSVVVAEGLLQDGLVVPAFVEGLEDVGEVVARKSVEVGGDGIQFAGHLVLLLWGEFSCFDIDAGSPRLQALVLASEPARELDKTHAQGVVAKRTRHGQAVDDMMVHIKLDKSSRVPIQRARAEHAEQVGLVMLVSAWEKKNRCAVLTKNFGRN